MVLRLGTIYVDKVGFAGNVGRKGECATGMTEILKMMLDTR